MHSLHSYRGCLSLTTIIATCVACAGPQEADVVAAESAQTTTTVERTCTIQFSDGIDDRTVTRQVRISPEAPVTIPIVRSDTPSFRVTIGTTRTTDVLAIAQSDAAPEPGPYVFAKVDDEGRHPASVLVTDLDASHWRLPAHGNIRVSCGEPPATPANMFAGYQCTTRRIVDGHAVRSTSIAIAPDDGHVSQQGGSFYSIHATQGGKLSMELSNSYYTSFVTPSFPSGVNVAKALSFVPRAEATETALATPDLYLEGACTRDPGTAGSEFIYGWDGDTIPDNDPEGRVFTGSRENVEWQAYRARRVQLSVQIFHGDVGQLELELTHAGKTVVVNRLGARAGADLFDTFEVPEFAGVDASGPWTLRVKDKGAGTVGQLQGWHVIAERPCPTGTIVTRNRVATPNAQIPANAPIESAITIDENLTLTSLGIDIEVAETPLNTVDFEVTNGVQTQSYSLIGGDAKFRDVFVIGGVGGLNAKGTWTLRMKDRQPGRAGTFKSWQMTMNGAADY